MEQLRPGRPQPGFATILLGQLKQASLLQNAGDRQEEV